jgi:ubiquinone/menaquinone biosynthesis C-methylase UbiE
MKQTNTYYDANKVKEFYNNLAPQFDKRKNKHAYYHEQIAKLYKFIISEKRNVLEIGCATGDLLASVRPSNGVGIDISEQMVSIAQKKYPRLKFIVGTTASIKKTETYDFIILSDLVGILEDIQQTFFELHKFATDDTRIIISYYNYLWEPVLTFAEKVGFKTPQPLQSRLSRKDIRNLLLLSELDIVKEGSYLLIPFYIPLLSTFANKYLARLPLIRTFNFVEYCIARKKSYTHTDKKYSVSVILPARNEEGNIEQAIKTIPMMGSMTQIIFVEDHSKDNTREEIKRVVEKYKNKREIHYFIQHEEYGKSAAVRRGFANATNDIVMVFDSDLTMDPKDLPKFYQALVDNKAELIMGSRLVYPMEKDAMRFLNILGNKFFSLVFSFLLDQQIKDTLCGTKVLFKKDYDKIVKNRAYFGEFDPFGDFDFIFGATKLNLKILEIPIRYKARVYGKTNIKRFNHGWLLFKMTFFAAKKIKFF